ncbi:MAG: hypothetical protein L0Z55_12150 [Planctomycetes bacterium]|nr:hypothetical protein [Planctomycetota bacterium]
MRPLLQRFAFAVGVLLPALCGAQDQSRDALEQKYQRKLAQPFVAATPWERELAKAMAKAAESERVIAGYFTRSYSP